MCDRFISSVHIQKLGHKIQEIRERALLSILSKLDHGFVYDNDLARSNEILTKLFEWFLLEPCTYQDVVLNLIVRILKTESGLILMRHYGKNLISETRRIRSCVEPKLNSLVDKIIELLKEQDENILNVPLLQPDVPLSYRTGDSNLPSFRSQLICSTASPIEGFVYVDSCVDQQTGLPKDVSRSEKTCIFNTIDTPQIFLPNLFLRWQPLISPDRHVLESVEHSLCNPTEPIALLHTCEFFIEVMLQDFPAEVFLQRPSIVNLFYEYLKTSTSSRLTTAILSCLHKLTKYLIVRINYYNDPCTYNLKQIICPQIYSEFSSPSSSINPPNTERPYIQSVHSVYSNCSSENDKGEDTNLLKSKQMSVSQYCFITMHCVFDYIYDKPEVCGATARRKTCYVGLNNALFLLDDLRSLLNVCLKPEMFEYKRVPTVVDILQQFDTVLFKFGEVLEHFRIQLIASDYNHFDRMIHLHLLSTCANLLVTLIPISKADFIIPKNLKSLLASTLLDTALARLYPHIHETFLQFVQEFGGQFEAESIIKYQEVKSVSSSMMAAIKLIRSSSSLSVLSTIQFAREGVQSLDFHKNTHFINNFIKICANKLPMHSYEEEILKIVDEIILSLLAHCDMGIKEETYKLCHKRVVAAVGPKLNITGSGAPGSQILFLVRTAILIEIAVHGVSSQNKQIQKFAEDILVLILKCKILVSDGIWNQIVSALIPSLPMFLCHAAKKFALGRTVISMLDPDRAQSFNLPIIEILKGNLCLLFVEDQLTRDEATSRLCWMLASQPESRDLLPRLNSVQDRALSATCMLQRIYDINKIQPPLRFYQASSLEQVLTLLCSDNVEPVIRRSALTQISVILEDNQLHATFFQHDGVNLIVNIMKSALIDNDYKDYPDSIIPAVSVLKNICLNNSTVRQELSNNLELYYWVLRGMYLYSTEERMKQDGSTLLCLLIFSNYILGSQTRRDLSMPQLVIDNLHMPFTCNAHWRTSHHTVPGLAASLLCDKWCLSSLQITWNSEWFGGFREILHWKDVNYNECNSKEFDEMLCLTNNDLLALKNTSLEYCMKRALDELISASSHAAATQCINSLSAYINLYRLQLSYAELNQSNVLKLPWQISFSKYAKAPPANEDDSLLLISVLKFMALLAPLHKLLNEECWIVNVLKDPCHCLPNLLETDSVPDSSTKILHQELLNLITVCACQEQIFLDLTINFKKEVQTNSTLSWIHVIQIIANNLKFNDAQHFYNLAYLDSLLSCLVHLTANLGWSTNKSSGESRGLVSDLILGLCELVGAFHCSKGSTAAASLMGLSITRHVLLILNHLLAELQHGNTKGWEMSFLGDEADSVNVLTSLSPLWLSRDVVLRAAVLQLLAGLALSPRAAIEVRDIKDYKGTGMWETALSIILDCNEAGVVREHATMLLANLVSHLMPTSVENITIVVNLSSTGIKQSKNVVGSLLNLLDDYKFYKELEILLTNLYIETVFYFDTSRDVDEDHNFRERQVSPQSVNQQECNFPYSRNVPTVQSLSSKTDSTTSNRSFSTITTPGLVKAVAVLVYNLLALAIEEVTSSLQEYGLIKLFFRSLYNPAMEIKNTKDLSLYCEILEMNTSICALLIKTVGNNKQSLGTILHSKDCLNVMLSLLNPSIYHTHFPQLIYLRNRLWTEVFSLIGVLLNSGSHEIDRDTHQLCGRSDEPLIIVSSALNECGHQPFLQTLCEAISTNSSADLQQSALLSLTSLLRVEAVTSLDSFKLEISESTSMQNLLDNTKTPRTIFAQDDINEALENAEPVTDKSDKKQVKIIWDRNSTKYSKKQQLSMLENVYFGKSSDRSSKDKIGTNYSRDTSKTDKHIELQLNPLETLMAGAELCKILLRLYDISSLKSESKTYRKKENIISTLTSILCVSHEAKQYALKNGLLQTVIKQIKDLHIKLSLESVECFRRVADKKRVCPLLRETGGLIGLLTNFMLGDDNVKYAATVFNLADLIHKLWIWFFVQKPLLVDALRMLCTYTTNCYLACQSLCLTSCVAGSGFKKVPSNMSIVHELILLISKEMDQVSRTHDLTILQLCFHLLHNACSAVECRNILAKGNLLQSLSRLHPAITKRQKPWESVELLWLEFLQTFTGYTEGQVCVAKTPDALEIIITLALSTKCANRISAMFVLRNIAFHQSNRPRLLTSDDFISILSTKLTSGTIEEKHVVVIIMWALAANNQRAKLVFKCANLDVKLQDALKRIHVSPEENGDPQYIETMNFVLNFLKEGVKDGQ